MGAPALSVIHRRSVDKPAASSAKKQKLKALPIWTVDGVNEHSAVPFEVTLVHDMPMGELYWNRVMAPFGEVAFSSMVIPLDGTGNGGFHLKFWGKKLRGHVEIQKDRAGKMSTQLL